MLTNSASVTTVNSQIVLTTPSGTVLNAYMDSNGSYYGSYMDDTPTTGPSIYKDSTGKIHYKTRNIKKKKVRGDTTSANSSHNRLKVLNPVVVYHFVKNRFRLLEESRYTKRLEIIAKFMENAKALGQIAMYDSVREKFGKIIREQELLACGYNKYITRTLADTFMAAAQPNIIKLTPLKNYVRPLPKKVQKVIDDVNKKLLFNQLLVMHTDVNNTSVAKTAEEKKDPILFGTLEEAPNILYFITDWIDEWCDLTFADLMKKMELTKKDVALEDNLPAQLLDAIL